MIEEQPFYAALGRNIRFYRDRAGLTQEGLAEKVNLTRTSVTNIEKGRQKILAHTLVSIAQTLAVPIHTILPSMESARKDLNQIEPEARSWIESTIEATREDKS